MFSGVRTARSRDFLFEAQMTAATNFAWVCSMGERGMFEEINVEFVREKIWNFSTGIIQVYH